MKVNFKDVSYIYQKGTPFEYEALHHIDTHFDEGRYYAIIGQTGSGKSTLIQQFNGLLKPTYGAVELDDLKIMEKTKDKAIRPMRQKIGMVFQFPESQLFEDNVEREILFGPKNFKMDLEHVKDYAYRLLMQLGFDRDIMEKSPFQMSGGQMRKIAIVSILAMDPDVIILDEPTAGLDPKSRVQVMSLFKQLQKDYGKTIVLVTHDMNDVAQYAENVKVMQKGSLMFEGTPRALFGNLERVRDYHLDLPDVVQLQYDFEQKYKTKLPYTALSDEEFIQLYKEWQTHEK
ncbi:energy-coupling factor transporter ATPase [Staphylococcus condimenti]|uniref:Energy-coupling factor transporter ATP-binding protein EcfA2 n=1 Tax=Staphylococcus condimenti TaxID=70255 RepID=A0A143PDF7_9STAP|nr:MULTISPECIES: energy-coupling factor transporter ATPase [Staphylococcus]AMY06541.1 energy-coupling factor transporter ATPase [Staphylococcus condimenti]APR60422.1 energy-coupling factor transporter ATPase [Staphylococcus condimenti]MDK8645944.1 energy-coupling factor transporter ATPase [Staphylococcus condimenti]OFP00601.1 energy-coupling factor transporter ATPase [Staphylococcus sp. HMSC065E08]PNZ62218.1 energy-coupling factor transporter ATPase [Staphylococcus condimenti]